VGPVAVLGVASGIAVLRTLRASQRLKAIIAVATTPMNPRALHGVAKIEASIDDMSMVDDPFLIL
jgi:hypothetical protein